MAAWKTGVKTSNLCAHTPATPTGPGAHQIRMHLASKQCVGRRARGREPDGWAAGASDSGLGTFYDKYGSLLPQASPPQTPGVPTSPGRWLWHLEVWLASPCPQPARKETKGALSWLSLFPAEERPRKRGQAPTGEPQAGSSWAGHTGATFTAAICSQERGAAVGVGLPAWPAPAHATSEGERALRVWSSLQLLQSFLGSRNQS